MTRVPQADHYTARRLSWTFVVDLTAPSHHGHQSVLCELDSLRRSQGPVVVRIGDVGPHDTGLDYRLPYALAAALDRDVQLHLEGTPGAVTSWWHELKRPPRDPARSRHLAAVR